MLKELRLSQWVFIAGFGLMQAGCGIDHREIKNSALGITHGTVVQGSDELARSVVALVANADQGQALCTGTLITEDSVLTAAHCVDENPSALMIVFSLRVQGADPSAVREVTSFVQNPLWGQNSPQGRGDLAVLHFEGGLPIGYQPVTLATADLEITAGLDVMMLGYGVTDGVAQTGAGVLRETETSVIDIASATEAVTDGQKTSVCFGDSGGPAFSQEGGQWVQWGVASSVLDQACSQASIHTEVASYLSWIQAAASKLRRSN
jgi:hypothetical protein